jgi:hypothetical protein
VPPPAILASTAVEPMETTKVARADRIMQHVSHLMINEHKRPEETDDAVEHAKLR